MAHLYNNHALSIPNPDDEDFPGYHSVTTLSEDLEYLIPLISDDERYALQNAVNVHLQHAHPQQQIQLVGLKRFRLTHTLD